MKTKINFRNNVQLTLWNNEYLGQFSDGFWSNTKGYDWEFWHNIEAKVSSENVGSNIKSTIRRYDLLDRTLIDCVGTRMLNLAKVAEAKPFLKIDKNISLIIIYLENKTVEYVEQHLQSEISKLPEGITAKDLNYIVKTSSFTLEDMKKEILNMKNILFYFTDNL